MHTIIFSARHLLYAVVNYLSKHNFFYCQLLFVIIFKSNLYKILFSTIKLFFISYEILSLNYIKLLWMGKIDVIGMTITPKIGS